MFAFSRTWVEYDLFPRLLLPVYTYLQKKKKDGLRPDFLWSSMALAHLMRLSLLKAAHAVMSDAAYRKSGSPIFFNPCTRKREHGAPVQGEGLSGKPGKRRTK
jgi:hypothetical protein